MDKPINNVDRLRLVFQQVFKQVLSYLKGTIDFVITYAQINEELKGYSDSRRAGEMNRKSFLGYIFIQGKGAVSWRSNRLGAVSVSSTEAELRSLLAAFKKQNG